MNVTINGKLYEGVWKDNTFKFETNMTLSEIEEAFISGITANIVVIEDEQEIARYYNKGLESITVTKTLPRFVTVIFDVTQISENAEEEINERMNDSDGAIIELAENINNIYEIIDQVPDFKNEAHEIKIDIQSIFRSIQSIIERLDKLEPHDEHNNEEE